MTDRINRRVFAISPFADPDWRWLVDRVDDSGTEWTFKNGNLYRWRSEALWIFYALKYVTQMRRADVVVSFHPHMSLAVACVMRMFGLKRPHYMMSFNHGNKRFFTGIRGWLARRLLHRSALISVFSEYEKKVYSEMYTIPRDKFTFTHWAVNPLVVDEQTEIQDQPYISSIGNNNRDNDTLISAVDGLPIDLIIVVGKSHLAEGKLPPRVHIHQNIPVGECAALLKGALFNVVPIIDEETGAGHMTLVSAMQFGKAQVVTRFSTVEDYFFGGVHGLWAEAGSVESMRAAIKHMLENASFREDCEKRAKEFSERWLCESAALRSASRIIDTIQNDAAPPSFPEGWLEARDNSHALRVEDGRAAARTRQSACPSHRPSESLTTVNSKG
jgi:glycosyltransferase involved in cell wall biosynthesis